MTLRKGDTCVRTTGNHAQRATPTRRPVSPSSQLGFNPLRSTPNRPAGQPRASSRTTCPAGRCAAAERRCSGPLAGRAGGDDGTRRGDAMGVQPRGTGGEAKGGGAGLGAEGGGAGAAGLASRVWVWVWLWADKGTGGCAARQEARRALACLPPPAPRPASFPRAVGQIQLPRQACFHKRAARCLGLQPLGAGADAAHPPAPAGTCRQAVMSPAGPNSRSPAGTCAPPGPRVTASWSSSAWSSSLNCSRSLDAKPASPGRLG